MPPSMVQRLLHLRPYGFMMFLVFCDFVFLYLQEKSHAFHRLKSSFDWHHMQIATCLDTNGEVHTLTQIEVKRNEVKLLVKSTSKTFKEKSQIVTARMVDLWI